MNFTVENHLVIFAKEPRLGRVKTRLARDIGKVEAWRFYRTMVQNVAQRLYGKGPWKTWLAVSPDKSQKQRRIYRTPRVSLLAQGRGDLGDRMLGPAQSLPPGRFVIVGTDVAGIRPDHIRAAFKVLGQTDCVFGPAEDGGFWLVGLKRHPILANPYSKKVRWSDPNTLNDCLNGLKIRNRKVGFVDMLSDIDDGCAYHRMEKVFGSYRNW